MRVFAYCCASSEEATRKAVGIQPITCPPLTMAAFHPPWLAERDLLYFDLHGAPGDVFWYGDDRLPALGLAQILEVDLGGAVVFASNCYLADEGSPMMDALLEAGAGYVIGGDGPNWGGERRLYGAHLLGLWLRWLLQIGTDPLRALAIAKRRLRLQLAAERLAGREKQAEAARDTLEFKAYIRRQE